MCLAATAAICLVVALGTWRPRDARTPAGAPSLAFSEPAPLTSPPSELCATYSCSGDCWGGDLTLSRGGTYLLRTRGACAKRAEYLGTFGEKNGRLVFRPTAPLVGVVDVPDPLFPVRW